MRKILSLFLLLSLSGSLRADDSSQLNRNRAVWLAWSNATVYAAGIGGLYQLWYTQYPMDQFHFFNDNREWAQMDKVGHVASCYMEGLAGIRMMQWAGFKKNQAIWIGGSYGLLWQGAVEVLDGFSSGWGFSSGDMLANTLGTALAIGQELAWEKQRIRVKYSFHATQYAQYRPELLGANLVQQGLKDYNGQTYWLSFNLASFSSESNRLPDWLNMALGYGIDGYLGAHSNVVGPNSWDDFSHIQRSRQFYLAPDLDFSKIEAKRTWVRLALHVLNSIKMPSPALEYQTGDARLRLRALYF